MILLIGCLSWSSEDVDGDGFVGELDCDDQDPAVHPEALDPLGDGLDTSCDGVDGRDGDGDGAVAVSSGGMDCDDDDPTVTPWAEEVCDGIDNDCDGAVDAEGCAEAVVPLSSVASVVITGDRAYDYAGIRSGGVGDLDDDGVDDVLIGGSFADYGASDGGSVWLLSGADLAAETSGLYAISTLAMARIDGQSTDKLYGHNSILRLGDVSGDGIDDLVLAVPNSDIADSGTGTVAIFWGGEAAEWGAQSITEADVLLTGVDSGDRIGEYLSAGDLDGDGWPDMVVSGTGSDTGGAGAGIAHLLSSASPAWDGGTHSLGTVASTLYGAPGEALGSGLAASGDLDGDGLDDLAIALRDGTWSGQPDESGIVYVFSGAPGLLDDPLSIGDADAVLWGGEVDGAAGTGQLSLDGDFDGDGRADLLALTKSLDDLHILHGAPAGLSSGLLSEQADATVVWDIDVDVGSAGVIGDFDGDGHDDVALGASQYPAAVPQVACTASSTTELTEGGAAALFSGAALSGVRMRSEPERLLTGPVGSMAGQSVSSAGDLNLDGRDDLLVSGQKGMCWRGNTWLIPGGAL